MMYCVCVGQGKAVCSLKNLNNRSFRRRSTPIFGHPIEECPIFLHESKCQNLRVFMCVCVCGGRGEGLAVRKTLVIGILGQCTVLWASNWGIPHMAVPSLRITYMKYGSIFFLINSVSRNFCPRSIISPFITSLYDIATQLQPSRIK